MSASIRGHRPGQVSRRIMILAGFAESVAAFRGPLIQELVARGLTVFVSAPFGAAPDAAASVAKLGAHPIGLAVSRTGVNPASDISYLLRACRVFRTVRPDIVLAYTAKPVIYGLVAARLCRVPNRYALITGLGYAFVGGARRSWLSRVVRSLYRWSLRGATAVFFQNPDDETLFRAEKLIAEDVPSVVVNGSGVDVATYACSSAPDGPASFLMISRILGDKGVREYVEAARIVRSRHPETKFAIAGWIDDGPDAVKESELRSWIEEGAVEYLGRLEDVRPALRACSVYVLPSYREGTPRTVLEAMATGRPIITTDAPGCRETVVDGMNGLLVPVKSVPDLVVAMERLVLDAPVREAMGRESRRLAEEKYDVNKVNQAMLSEMGIDR